MERSDRRRSGDDGTRTPDRSPDAHDPVYAACRRAVDAGRPLFEVLAETQDVAIPLGRERLHHLTDPANYLGSASQMVDRILQPAPHSCLEE
nr:hypothetical protein [Rhizobium sp. H4]